MNVVLAGLFSTLNQLQMNLSRDDNFTLDWADNFNSSESPTAADVSLNLWPLWLIPLPLITVIGNGLVVVAVLTEKSLKTPTNYLLVSLATADLLVGIVVQPFSIYLIVHGLRWELSTHLCNLFITSDVAASTASIINLFAISMERFFAVVRHVEYRSTSHNLRILVTIVLVWAFSICLSLPLGIGLYGTDQGRCEISNVYYIFFGSIFAFYIPSTLMVVMYGVVFRQLRGRMRTIRLQEMAAGQMVNFSANLNQVMTSSGRDLRRDTLVWAMPFIKTLEETEQNENEEVSSKDIEELTTILYTLETDSVRYSYRSTALVGTILEEPDDPMVDTVDDSAQSGLVSPTSGIAAEPIEQKRLSSASLTNNDGVGDGGRTSRTRIHFNMADSERRDSENSLTFMKRRISKLQRQLVRRKDSRKASLYSASEKIRGLKTRAVELLMKIRHKEGQAVRKESRATKLVATVLGLFLCCWLPFFTLNMVKVFGVWSGEMGILHSLFTWLGYLNSTLNPAIYSLVNRHFRTAFRKLVLRRNPKNSHKSSSRRSHAIPSRSALFSPINGNLN